MSEETVDFEIELENVEEVKAFFRRFGDKMDFAIYDSLMITANKEERILKGTMGFSDKTGHLRRSLFVTAVLNPLGIEMGSYAKYAPYVAYGHGTWIGGFWDDYVMEAVPRILDSIDRSLNRLIREADQEGGA